MSGTRALHVQRRNGVYHLRLRVPDAIRSRVGLTEVVRSLRTYSISHARHRAARHAALVMKAFEVIQASEMKPVDAKRLINECFVSLLAEQESVGAYSAISGSPDLELLEQREIAREYIAALKRQLGSDKLNEAVAR